MKRAFDLVVSVIAVVVLSPLMVTIAVAVAASSPGGAIFRQERVGRRGRPFTILKFRTMRNSPDAASQITIGRDPRITRLGARLRAAKLDELPQLVNVVRGDMSLVGPRPELPTYVARWPAGQRDIILSVRPGITDPASIWLRDEARLLAMQDDPARYYETVLTPAKLAAYVTYVQSRSMVGDVKIVVMTIAALLGRSHSFSTPGS